MNSNPGYQTMKMRPLVCLIFVASLLAACVSNPIETRTNAKSGADFSQYQSFYFLPVPPGRPGQVVDTTFHRRTATNAVREQLTARGFSETKDKNGADVSIALQFSIHEESRLVEVVDYEYEPVAYGYGYGYGYGYRSYYGYAVHANTSIEIDEFLQGNMIIDMIDNRSQTLVWEGYARGEGTQSLKRTEQRINRAVTSIFKKFPRPVVL